jgi:DNA-binding NarL/FixJ family response regulator
VAVGQGSGGDPSVGSASDERERPYAGIADQNGTDGLAYLLKERVGDVAELMRALTEVCAGRTALDTRIVDALIARGRTLKPSKLDGLTDRERDVLRQMARGLDNTGIAETLSLSESAVEKHISSIFAKLGHNEQPNTHRRGAAVLDYLSAACR